MLHCELCLCGGWKDDEVHQSISHDQALIFKKISEYVSFLYVKVLGRKKEAKKKFIVQFKDFAKKKKNFFISRNYK